VDIPGPKTAPQAPREREMWAANTLMVDLLNLFSDRINLHKSELIVQEWNAMFARADCLPVCLKADCLPNRANTEPRRQPDDVQPVADNKNLDVSTLVAMVANTTQCEFESVSGEDHAQVMRPWVVAETNVEAIDVKVDVVLAGADDEE